MVDNMMSGLDNNDRCKLCGAPKDMIDADHWDKGKHGKELLTRTEIARVLGITPHTVKRWEKNGLPKFQKGSKFVRYDLEQVLAWLQPEERQL